MNSALSIDPSKYNETHHKAYDTWNVVQFILLGSEIRDLSATEAIICGYQIGSSRNLIYLSLNNSTAAD